MTERCIVRVKFTLAGSAGEVRRAVGGFLRYVQQRDLHPDSTSERPTPDTAGSLKYVAYRDGANTRAELFGPHGSLRSRERKEFADFVTRSIADSRPQPYRTRDGQLMDRRRAVSHLIISPEHAQGLDFIALTRAVVGSLDSGTGIDGLRWIAAIHRNTRHHHVHLVVAGMADDGAGGYRRVDVTKPRLTAMKEAVALEIERQRRELVRSKLAPRPTASEASGREPTSSPALQLPMAQPAHIPTLPLAPLARFRVASTGARALSGPHRAVPSSLLALRAVARRYSHQMHRELEEQARRRDREGAS